MASISEQVSVAYEPPAGLTPALARMFHIGGYDTRTFAVEILDLVQQGHVQAEDHPGGGIMLTRLRAGGMPWSGPGMRLLKDLMGRDGQMLIARESYSRLLHVRKRHHRALTQEKWRLAGNGGAYIMAGLGIFIMLMIFALGVIARQPLSVSASEALLPYWWLPVLCYGGLYLHRRKSMKKGGGDVEAKLSGYRRYLETVMINRVNPDFMADRNLGRVERDAVYVAALGLENGWADPLVHLLESILPATVTGVHLHDVLEASELTEKRGFAPRKQPGMWGPRASFWRLFGEDPDE